MLAEFWTTLKQMMLAYVDDNALSRGAAIAYYTVLSVGPLLVICIAIAGLVFGHDAAQGAIIGQLRGLMGNAGAEVIQSAIKSAGSHNAGVWATILGIATLLVTSSGVFAEMQSSLNAIWKAEPKGGLSAILKARAASLGLVGTLGFLLLVSLVISAVLNGLGASITGILPGAALVMEVVNTALSFLIVVVLFAAVYKILPDRRLRWRDVMVGAVMTAALFTIGKMLIGLYISSSAIATSYGAASALAIVLAWIYYSAQIFLLGAEFTKVWASRHGSWEAIAARTDHPVSAAAVQKAAVPRNNAGAGGFEVAAAVLLLVFVIRWRLTPVKRITPPAGAQAPSAGATGR